MQHTPKQWKVYPDSTGTFVASSSGRVVAANLYDENTDTPIEEVDANARLIAAAPELLDAAETAVKIIRGSYGNSQVDLPGNDRVVSILERVIKQAKGGGP